MNLCLSRHRAAFMAGERGGGGIQAGEAKNWRSYELEKLRVGRGECVEYGLA